MRAESRTTRLRSTPVALAGVLRAGCPRRAPTRGRRCAASFEAAEARWQSSTSTTSCQLPRRWKPSDELARRARRRSTRACCGSASARRRGSIGSSSKPSRRPIRRRASSTCALLLARAGARTAAPCQAAPGQGSPSCTQVSATRSRRGPQDLDRRRLGVAALRLRDPRADAVAGQRAGDEHDVAVGAGDPAAALGQRVDLELELLGPRAGRCDRGAPAAGAVSAGRLTPNRVTAPMPLDLDAYRAERRGVHLGDRPRVLPAPGRPQAGARDRADLRPRTRGSSSRGVVAAIRERRGGRRRLATRPGGCATCSRSRSTGCIGRADQGEAEEAARGWRRRSRSRRMAGRSAIARCRWSRRTRRDARAPQPSSRRRATTSWPSGSTRSTCRRWSARTTLCRELGWSGYAAAYAEVAGHRPRRARRADARAFCARPRARLPRDGRPRGSRWPGLPGPRRAAPLRPAAVLPRGGARRAVPGGAPGAVAGRDAAPGSASTCAAQAQRPSRHRAAADEVAARVLLAGAGARRGLPRDRAGRRARRLRRAVPRGRAHRALRQHDASRSRSSSATSATTR